MLNEMNENKYFEEVDAIVGDLVEGARRLSSLNLPIEVRKFMHHRTTIKSESRLLFD